MNTSDEARPNLLFGVKQLQELMEELDGDNATSIETDQDIANRLQGILYQTIYPALQILYDDYEMLNDPGGERPAWKETDPELF